MNAKTWFYSQSFNGGTREPQPEPPSSEVEELEKKEAPSSSTGFMDRKRPIERPFMFFGYMD